MPNSIHLIEVETPYGAITRRLAVQRVSRSKYAAIVFLDGVLVISFWSRSERMAQQNVERWLRGAGRRYDGKSYEVIRAEAKSNPLPKLREA
jgi:hypothetical protein